VVVYLTIRPAAIHPDYQKTERFKDTLRIEKCRFEPRVSLVRTGQTLNVENGDPVAHHAHVYSAGQDVSSPDAAQSKRQTFRFAESTNVPALVECDVHRWMRGWVLVRDSPYMAVTDKDGTFEIKNLPSGVELEFEAWHEIPGSVDGRFTCLIPADQTHDLGTIKITADRMKPGRGSGARK
jgi:plastocyanin